MSISGYYDCSNTLVKPVKYPYKSWNKFNGTNCRVPKWWLNFGKIRKIGSVYFNDKLESFGQHHVLIAMKLKQSNVYAITNQKKLKTSPNRHFTFQVEEPKYSTFLILLVISHIEIILFDTFF